MNLLRALRADLAWLGRAIWLDIKSAARDLRRDVRDAFRVPR